jgi:UDP-N-acetylmuramate--alanine ligase
VTSQDERLKATGLLGTLEVNAVGAHNVRNALAACAVGLCLGMRFGLIAEGLTLFDGVQRRLQVCGEHKGVIVVEDYAHHPTEIASRNVLFACSNRICTAGPSFSARISRGCWRPWTGRL